MEYKDIGTLAEIGAQVGDVVEFVEWFGGNDFSGNFAIGKQYEVKKGGALRN